MDAEKYDGRAVLNATMREAVCKFQHIAIGQLVPNTELLDLRLNARPDEQLRGLVLTMYAKLLAFIPGVESISFPKDWWQAVKERWAPRWVLKRWPVKYHTYEALEVLKGLNFPLDVRERHPRFFYIYGEDSHP